MFQNKNAASVRANSLFDGVDKNFKLNINQKDFLEKKEGDIIFSNSDNAEHIYLVIEGEVKLKISGVFSSPVIVKSSKNEFFGEKELLENIRRSSSAVANTECLLFRIEKNTLNQLAGQNRTIRRNLYKSLLIDEPDEHSNNDSQKKFILKTEESPKKFKISEEKPKEKIKPESSVQEPEEKNIPGKEDVPEEKSISPEIEIPEESLLLPDDEIPILTENADISNENIESEKILDSEYIAESTLIEDDFSLNNENVQDESSWNFTTPDEISAEDPENNFYSRETFEEPESSSTIAEPLIAEEPLLPVEEKISFEPEVSLNKLGEDEMPLAAADISTETQVQEYTAEVSGSTNIKELTELMSNDLSYPVSALKFYAEQIKKRNMSEELNEVADLIIEQAQIISSFSESAQDFAYNRISLNRNPISINSLMDEVLGLLADYIESRNSRLFKKYNTTAVVNIDKAKFYQAMFQVTKIVCNSIEDGGVYVTSSSENNFVTIEIRSKLQQPKEQTGIPSFGMKELSGIGLSIATKIIKEHGGDILINDDEHGSKFVITIPAFQ